MSKSPAELLAARVENMRKQQEAARKAGREVKASQELPATIAHKPPPQK
jgi:hypothetical protein